MLVTNYLLNREAKEKKIFSRRMVQIFIGKTGTTLETISIVAYSVLIVLRYVLQSFQRFIINNWHKFVRMRSV